MDARVMGGTDDSNPSLVDRGFQVAYFFAYRLMRRYWKLRHPKTHGALVAVWHQGAILLVKNSYLDYFSLPGGYVRRQESGRDAAVRELREEIGLNVSKETLVPSSDETHEWEGKIDRVEIFALDVDQPPSVRIDHREVVSARFHSVDEAMRLRLFPPLRRHIEERQQRHHPNDAEHRSTTRRHTAQ